jgi:hypothetical protein
MHSSTQNSVCFAVDIGSKNLCIAKARLYPRSIQSIPPIQSKLIPIISSVSDSTGMRIIPNQIYYPPTTDTDSIRLYGSSVVESKSFPMEKFRNYNNYNKNYEGLVFGQQFSFPIAYLNNNVCCGVKDIISTNLEETEYVKRILYTSSYYQSQSTKNTVIRELDRAAIQTLLSMDPNMAHDTEFIEIDDLTALVGSYIQRYVMDSSYCIGTPVNCVILDAGGSKTQVIYLTTTKMSDKNIFIKVNHHKIAGSVTIDDVDEKFQHILIKKNLERNLSSEIRKIPHNQMSNAIKKIRHIMSTNKSYVHYVSLPDSDVAIHVDRNDLDLALIKSGYINQLEKLLNNINIDMAKHKQNHIMIVGGCSRIVKVEETIMSFISAFQTNITILRGVHADEAVAIGSAFIGSIIDDQNISIIYSRPIDQNVRIVSNNTIVKSFTKNEYSTMIIGKKTDENKSYENNSIILQLPKQHNISGTNTITQFYDSENLTMSTELIPNSCKSSYTTITGWGLTDRIVIDCPIQKSILFNRTTQETIDLDKIKLQCRQTETNFQKIERFIEIKRELINDIEEYYSDSSKLIDVISKILNIIPSHLTRIRKSKKTDSEILSYIIDYFCRNKPISPVKELYEFYVFCDSYMFDKSTSILSDELQLSIMSKKQYIQKLLDQPESANSIAKVIELVKLYKIQYSN